MSLLRVFAAAACLMAVACTRPTPPPVEPVHETQTAEEPAPARQAELPLPEPISLEPPAPSTVEALPMPSYGNVLLPPDFAAAGAPDGAPRDERLSFSADLPEGWRAFPCPNDLCKLMLVQKDLTARLLLLPLVPAKESAVEAVEKMSADYETELSGDATVDKAEALPNSDCATARIVNTPASGNADMTGLITSCLIGPKKAYLVFYMGGWPKTNDAKVTPDVHAVLRSTKLVPAPKN